MKRILTSIVLSICCSAVTATDLQTAVDAIINQVDPSIHMGMVVLDLNTGETLYQRNPTDTFVPASNMKLFSDAAALLALGPDYRFKSQLTTDATLLDDGLLKGSIYIHLPGDPSLTQDHLDTLLTELQTLGVKQIQGNVVLISNNAQVDAYAPGRMATDTKHSYGAPISPVVFDENRLTVTVNPAYRAGDAAVVELSNPNTGLVIDNQIKTAKKDAACGVNFTIDDENHLIARGCVGVGQWAIQQRIPINNPLQYAQSLIKSHLANLNIKLDGQVELGAAPPSSLLLASHQSKPIAQLMADTLKPSDNLYADSLFLHTAAKLNGSPVNWDQAQTVVKNFLQQQTGINLEKAVLTDGSGLSRQDLITAQQTVDLLRFLYERFPLAYEYIAALPVAGLDGTLERRFRKPNQQGLLRAKTGTMSGVMSLSGYLYSANSHTLAFAIYINKTPETKPAVSGRYRSLIDSLCDFFLRQKPDNHQFAGSENPLPPVAFQQQPTQTERQRTKYAKWRQLELAVKQSLQGQAINVLFRGNQLVLIDNSANIDKVWGILEELSKTYHFTVMLQGTSSPTDKKSEPLLLWMKTNDQHSPTTRTWTLHELVA